MKKPKQRLELGREVVKALVTQIDETNLRQVEAGACPHSAIVNVCGSGSPLCNIATERG